MITFIGEITGKMDDKGRLVFPSAFKSLMPADGDMRFVVKRNLIRNCLDMFTFEEWERQANEVKSRLNFFNKEHASFWDKYMRDSEIVEPDSKIGRLSISRKLLESIGVTKEVVFAGKGFKIEIWDKTAYQANEISDEKFLEIASELSQQG